MEYELNPHPLAVSVKDTQRMLGIGATSTWALIGKQELQTIQIGRRRLVMLESIHAFVERRRQAASVPNAPEHEI